VRGNGKVLTRQQNFSVIAAVVDLRSLDEIGNN
jgi:hypothetical protein